MGLWSFCDERRQLHWRSSGWVVEEKFDYSFVRGHEAGWMPWRLDVALPLPRIGWGETKSKALSFITLTGHLRASFVAWVAWVHRFRASLETSNYIELIWESGESHGLDDCRELFFSIWIVLEWRQVVEIATQKTCWQKLLRPQPAVWDRGKVSFEMLTSTLGSETEIPDSGKQEMT